MILNYVRYWHRDAKVVVEAEDDGLDRNMHMNGDNRLLYRDR